MGEHITAAGSEHVHFLTNVILQLLKLGFGPSDLGLDLATERHNMYICRCCKVELFYGKGYMILYILYFAKLLQLFVSVRVQLMGDVLHPEQCASVLRAGFLHTSDRQ